MTVQELIDQLQALPEKHMPVVIAYDPGDEFCLKLECISLDYGQEDKKSYELVPDDDEFEDREQVLVLCPAF
jgi:hypothetical protein